MNSSSGTQSTKLIGDWTIEGVGQQLHQLNDLPICNGAIDSGSTVAIDCAGIERIDMSGLQLLYVWIQCIRLRGFQPSLCNIPEKMMSSLACLGMADNFEHDLRVTA